MQTEHFQLHSRMEETHWWFTARRDILRRLALAVLPPGKSILDVGCGTGGNLAAFAETHRCLGWDPSEEAIRLARRRHPTMQFLSGNLDAAFASLSEAPDLILALDVLEHVENDRALFEKLADQVRPGGHLLLTVPAGMELWSPQDVAVGHFRRYTRTGLEQLWKNQPVTPRAVSYFNTRLYPIVRGVRFWTRRNGRASGEAQTDFRLPPKPVNRMLHGIFAGESAVLLDLLHQKRLQGFSRGVSLIALLEKTEETAHAF